MPLDANVLKADAASPPPESSPRKQYKAAATLVGVDQSTAPQDTFNLEQALIKLEPRLRRHALWLTRDKAGARNKAEADDLVQDTFERILNKTHLYTRNTNFLSWSMQVMNTVFINGIKKDNVRKTVLSAIAVLNKVSESELFVPEPSGDPLRITERKAALRLVGKLPQEYQQVVLLTAFEGLSYPEAAAAMNIPISTVATRLMRARDRLNNMIKIDRESENWNFYWLHPDTKEAYFADHKVKLTARSSRLMTEFIASAGEMLNGEQLRQALGSNPKQISPYVSSLRKELALDMTSIGRLHQTSTIETIGLEGWCLKNGPEQTTANNSSAPLRQALTEFSFSGFFFVGNGENGIYFNNKKLPLNKTETKLLATLFTARGEPVPSAALHKTAYSSFQSDKRHEIQIHLSNIRKKLQKLGFDRGFIKYSTKSSGHTDTYTIDINKIPSPEDFAKVVPLANFRGSGRPAANPKVTPLRLTRA